MGEEPPRVELDAGELLELIGLLEAAAERLRSLASESLEWRPLMYQSREGEVKVGYWRRLPDAGDWIEVEVRPLYVDVERWEDHRPLRWLWRELKERVDGRLWVSEGRLRISLQPGDGEGEADRERRLETALRMAAWSLWALSRSLSSGEEGRSRHIENSREARQDEDLY